MEKQSMIAKRKSMKFYLNKMDNNCNFKPYGQEELICKSCGYVIWKSESKSPDEIVEEMISVGYQKPECKETQTIEETKKRNETEKHLKEIDIIRNSPLKDSDKSFAGDEMQAAKIWFKNLSEKDADEKILTAYRKSHPTASPTTKGHFISNTPEAKAKADETFRKLTGASPVTEDVREAALRIAETIFYSPATNGRAKDSIENGVSLIIDFAQSQQTGK